MFSFSGKCKAKPGDPIPGQGEPRKGASYTEDDEPWGVDLEVGMGHNSNPVTSIISTQNDDHTTRKYPRISLSVEMMRDSYDVVVIGTGYGGGVAASRMARGKQRVCVLERGKERWPGEFPETIAECAKEIHVSGEFAPGDRRSIHGSLVEGGNPTGLYQFMVGEGQNVYMGYGLGGTSLINANVFIEATPAVLDMEVWPRELRGAESWRKYYDRASEVLQPTEYPENFPRLAKADLLQRQAELMGYSDKFYRVKQTTRFEDGPNSTGVHMRKSTLTGMDATGINDGSKSTTLVNYMSDAWNWGAEIFCECEVRYVTKAPSGEGYIVWFAWRSGNRDVFSNFHEDLMWVHAKKCVFFGAGAIGTTEILLRSKQLGLDLSDQLGKEMSGNGDMLGFGYDTKLRANCVATPEPGSKHPVGPCITSVLDLRDTENPLQGFVIEDCAAPSTFSAFSFMLMKLLPGILLSLYAWAFAAMAGLGNTRLGRFFTNNLIRRTPVYLVMSHDSSQGNLTLKNNRPVLTYSGVGRSAAVSRIHAFLEKMTSAVGGKFIPNPVWSFLGKQEITVHPIGGARVSSDGSGGGGVTNHMGELFIGNGTKTHAGLVVCDGAAIPAAVGVNPFATITAFAERSVELVSRKYGIEIDLETKNGTLDLFGNPAHRHPRDGTMAELAHTIAKAKDDQASGLGFSEIMSGYIHASSDVEDFEVASRLARSRCESARLFLTARSHDSAQLLNTPDHNANLTGTFTCEALGGTFMVHRGTFQLFSQDDRQPDTTNLVYDFDMTSNSGTKLHFNGYKTVNTASFLNPWKLWSQTTTLYVTITDNATQVVGRGTLNIRPADFMRQLRTFETTGPTMWSRMVSATNFLIYFTKQLSIPFFSTLGHLQYPTDAAETDFKSTRPSETIPVVASDGVVTTMLKWDPIVTNDKAQDDAPTILFISAAAMDHTLYALPTIEKNAIDYFCEAGYRAYCLNHRVGRAPTADEGHTAYDVRLDIQAALMYIRKIESARGGNPKPYVIAHCVGSMALSCGLLDGTIPADWMSGITASMVFMNPKLGRINDLMSRVPVGVYRGLVGDYWNCYSNHHDSYFQQLLNHILRFYPVGSARETCRSVVCHRTQFAFGRLWSHENINEATHRYADRFLGGTSMNSTGWLLNSGRTEHVTGNGPSYDNLVTPENIERLKDIPILFLSGSENMIYTPENTDTSYTTLCNAHGRQWYEREVIIGRGHADAWMGATAHLDVYPRIQRHVDKIMRS